MINTQREILPIIDWELATSRAGGNHEIAKEILTMLTKTLLADVANINQTAEEEDYVKCAQYVHRLHGATAYCGVPRLQAILKKANTELKENKTEGILALVDQLNIEANALMKAAQA